MKTIVIGHFLLLTLLPFTTLALKADFQFTDVCLGKETTLINTSTPKDSIYRVLWDLDGDGKFGDAFTDTVKIVFPNPGTYYIGVKVIAFSGAMDAVYKTVSVVSVQAAFTYDFSCRNLPVHFFDRSVVVADAIFQYTWKFGDGTPNSFLPNPTHNYSAAGNYPVTLTVVTLKGCIDSVKHVVPMKDPPLVDVTFSGDTVFPLGDSVIVTIVGPYDSVFWSTGEKTGSIVIRISGYYYVRGFREGCYGEYHFSVTAVEDHSIRVMSVFTPNGDGFNDRWEIINIDEIAPCQVDVFDRWGQKVFSSPQYNNDWEGTYRGKILSNDTYYYFIRCADGLLRKGPVNIVK